MPITAVEADTSPWNRGPDTIGTADADVMDAQRFNALYASHLRAVFNYARYRVGSADAEDVTADVFARAWSNRADQDARRGSADAWLWAIARNALADRFRKRDRHAEPLSDDVPAPRDPRAEASDRLDLTRVLTSLAELPDVDQEIIALRFGADLPHREIAALLGLSEANAAQRLRRALTWLRRRHT